MPEYVKAAFKAATVKLLDEPNPVPEPGTSDKHITSTPSYISALIKLSLIKSCSIS